MDEHDDDLASSVQEDAAEETDAYPDTGDQLDDVLDVMSEDDEESGLDEDESEL